MQIQNGVAAGLIGVAMWEIVKAYGSAAPSLTDLRRAETDDVDHRQRLLDADIMVGGLALIAGAAASWLMRSWVPVVLSALAFVWVSGWHHAVQACLTPEQI